MKTYKKTPFTNLQRILCSESFDINTITYFDSFCSFLDLFFSNLNEEKHATLSYANLESSCIFLKDNVKFLRDLDQDNESYICKNLLKLPLKSLDVVFNSPDITKDKECLNKCLLLIFEHTETFRKLNEFRMQEFLQHIAANHNKLVCKILDVLLETPAVMEQKGGLPFCYDFSERHQKELEKLDSEMLKQIHTFLAI